MPIEKLKGSKCSLVVTNADNQLVAYVNGIEIYNRTTDGDPTLNDPPTDFSNLLQPGLNTLLLIGIDWGAAYHFAGHIQIDNTKRNFSAQAPSTKGGKIWNFAMHINKP